MTESASIVERVIETISPSWALERAKARAVLGILARNYEGATLGRRTLKWRAPPSGPNTAAIPAIRNLRNRTRDLARNNPWARRAVALVRAGTIGTGIMPSPVQGSARAIANARALWKDWGETPACDADGQLDFYGLQGLAMQTIAESGEVIIRRRRRRVTDSLPIPFQIQVLEPDYIDDLRDRLIGTNGERVIGGIQFDALGRRSGYWMFREHPGEAFRFGTPLSSEFVDASEIRHVYWKDRPGQCRGVPWGASAVIRLKELDELEDAALVQQKIAACFAAFERDLAMPEEEISVDSASGTDEETIEPGTIRKLGSGKTIEFTKPPDSANFEAFQRAHLRGIARSFGVPYEAMTGDYSQSNYSSSRLGLLEYYKAIDEWRWQMVAPQMFGLQDAGAWPWFTQAAELAGYGTLGVRARWTPPRREMIDPAKEVPAARDAVRSGFQSQSETLRELGYHPEEVLEEIAADNKRLDELGILLDSDGRRAIGKGAGSQSLEQPAGT